MKKGEKRKLELLQIAYSLFLAKGYENTSVDEIIAQAGMAKGTFYYYFRTKEQLLDEVIDMMLDTEEERARAIIQADISVPEKLIGVISSFRPDTSEAPITEALHDAQNIVMHEVTGRKLMARIVPLLSEVGRQGVSEGLFECDDIPERVRQIVILSTALFDDSDSYTEADIRVFIDTVERIMYAQPGSMNFISQLLESASDHK